ncbi:DivIVA domain-containing protein [Raineyella antarctica]|uniref:Cell wall synthesis protein Wag31 n=1 Tax=Raineyella antarctica TaxID=1577474 RepID=A0A1G6GE35_9ACTN|nr:DivIVA domain-containing protein [Raineyella antarctica]SDB80169.1 DivIVA domain-containing protein [Raineyella antarctica]
MTTLTLDEVRNTKFHMARRAGYEVTDVDLFVDRVEASFAKLVEENEMLRRQVEALQQAADNAAEAQQATSQFQPVMEEPEPSPVAVAPAPAPEPVPAPVAQPVQAGIERIVVTTSSEASPAVVRLVQMATEQAERLVAEAETEAHSTIESANRQASETIENADRQASETIENANRQASETIDNANRQATEAVDGANRQAHEITTDAQTRADRIQSEARVNAERLVNEAQSRADNLDNEVNMRRAELFSGLEDERDQLQRNVVALREYESTFRRNFGDRIRQQLAALEEAVFEPENRPALAQDLESRGQQGSSTPRLDALMGGK